MWWCIKYFTVFGLTGLVLQGRIFKGVGVLMHPSPVVGQGLVPVCAFTPLWLQPCSYLDPQELVQGTGGWLCSPQPLSQPVRAMLVLRLELSPDVMPQSTSTGWGGGGSASLEPSAPRDRLAPAGTPALIRLHYPTVSDAFLLKAKMLSSEQSLCHGDCSIFSDFFSNPLDQREKIQSALSLLQQPVSWSRGSTMPLPNDGCEVTSQSSAALAYPQPPALPLACTRDA